MKSINFLFNLLIFLVPLTFVPVSSELFEFNKMILVYLLTVLISSSWIFECLRQGKFIFNNTKLTLPLLLFLLSQILATVFSIDSRTSLLGYYGRFHGGLLSTVCYVILYFAFVTFMRRKQTLKLINIFLVSSAIAAGFAAAEHFGASPSCLIITGELDVNCWTQDVQTRVFGTFGQPNWLAAFLVAVIPITWFKTIDSRFRQKRYLFLALGYLFFITLLFTKSRSGLLGFGFASAIFWPAVFYFSRKKLNKTLPVFAVVVIYTILSVLFIWNPFAAAQEPPMEGVTESGDIRRIVWQGAIELWEKYPILGTGVETFAYSYYETRPMAHNLTSEWNYIYNKAHNEYLNFAATTGTVGLASYLLLIFTSLFQICTLPFPSSKLEEGIKRWSIFKTALLTGYVTLLVTNFFGFSTVSTALIFFLFPAMAVSVSSIGYQVSSIKLKFSSNFQKMLQVFLAIAILYTILNIGSYWLADYYYAKGDVLSLEQAVAFFPQEAVYRSGLGEAYLNVSPQLAELELEQARELAPRNVRLLKSIASGYDSAGRTETALEIYQELTLLAPTDVQTWYQLALAQAKLGNIAEARNTLTKVLMMKPDYELARKLNDYIK